jgi:anti-sigma factor RsiW
LTCQITQAFIHAYVDGELDLGRSVEVEQHMQECQACANAYRSQTALRSALRDSSLYHSAPARLEKRIRSSLRREAKSEVGRRLFGWRWLPVGVALALVLLMALVMWQAVPGLRPAGDELLAQEMVSNHVRSLQLESHRIDVISSDQHTVKPWFDGKLDFAPPVKDLSSQGFPLLGGRLEYLNNRAVAVLIYQRQKHFINLYIWPAEQSNATEVATKRQGYNLLHWTNSGMNYWAISDLNGVELHEFARLVQEAQ